MYPSLSHMQHWFRESSLLFVMPCALSHSIVKVFSEAKMAEMEANYKKACKNHVPNMLHVCTGVCRHVCDSQHALASILCCIQCLRAGLVSSTCTI